METIWKFPFSVKDEVKILMPSGAEILSVQVQGSHPCIWAKCYSDAPLKERRFNVFGTGHRMPIISERREYVGTFQMLQGQLVFHLFEIK